jgi:hypothetical protein
MAQDPSADAATVRQLQRVDPATCGVLAKSRHAALYTFRVDATGKEVWDKEKLEGMFYLTRRQGEPRFALCILNKMGGGDLSQTLKFCTSEFEYEFNRNFFIFRINGLIRSVWLMEDDLEAVKCAVEAAERETMNTPPAPKYVSRKAGDEVLSMEELRESLFRLISTDKFMQNLHTQYLESEKRKRAPSATHLSPLQQPMMGFQHPPPPFPPSNQQPPQQFVMYPSGHPQQAGPLYMQGGGQGRGPGMYPPPHMAHPAMNLPHQHQAYQNQQ